MSAVMQRSYSQETVTIHIHAGFYEALILSGVNCNRETPDKNSPQNRKMKIKTGDKSATESSKSVKR